MVKSYFRRTITLVLFVLGGIFVLLQAAEHFMYHPYSNYSNAYSPTSPDNPIWMLPNNYLKKKEQDWASIKARQRFLFHKYSPWRFSKPRLKKEGDQELDTAHYKAEESIIFDAKKNILSLHGTSVLDYDHMKLEANSITLNFNNSTITAEGTKDQHNKSVENPVFTFKDVEKNKYGKDGPTKTQTFFMEKIDYNINTKRAIAHKLLTKQQESIVKSEQVKKEDEETFYAKDLIYTTCALERPHFYIRSRQVKMIKDKQITSGPFGFYFDDVPSHLGFVSGTFFLEGKRTHGIIPPDMGEEQEKGFYLRDGGYYINFNDYADISILGTIYSNGPRELKNRFRYKKRYLWSGDVSYTKKIDKTSSGWALEWVHKHLEHSSRSLNANVNLHSEGYKTTGQENNNKLNATQQQSSASVRYKHKLIGFPYGLVLDAQYKHNFLSNFTHWILPKATLDASWYPFRLGQSRSKTVDWFYNVNLQHTIDFETHFQNAAEDHTNRSWNSSATNQIIPSNLKWNNYTENGVLHTLPLNTQAKLFKFINLTPNFTYTERWYWKKLFFEDGTSEPIQVPGFNRVYSWNYGVSLGTTLYCTHYFNESSFVKGFRIKTEPSISFSYEPDFSKEKYGFFQEIENEQGKKEKKYAFENFRPVQSLRDRASAILTGKLKNSAELKVNKEIDPNQKKKEKQQTSRKIPLLKNLDFEVAYDFKAKEFNLTKVCMRIASEVKVGKIGKLGFDLNTTFDPYLFKIVSLPNGNIKEERINAFAWHHGQYLGRVERATWRIHMDCASAYDSREKEKKKALLSDSNNFINGIKEKDNKIDFETPWDFGWDFTWQYHKKNKDKDEYKDGEPNYRKDKFINFHGGITLVKKWKLSARSSYDFTKNELNPDATEISIQRDLHCWQLSYQWHPLGNQSKYDFSLGVKANVLKALKLPRKRVYNRIK